MLILPAQSCVEIFLDIFDVCCGTTGMYMWPWMSWRTIVQRGKSKKTSGSH